MSDKWMEIISNSKEGSVVFDIPTWLSRATLDAIGEGTCCPGVHNHIFLSPFSAAFDVRFNSVDNNEDALARSYRNIMSVLTSAKHLVFP
jgi:hypothetical protein